MTFLLIIEISLSNISDIFNKKISSPSGISLIILIFFVCLIGEYLLLKKIKQNQDKFENEITHIKKINKSITYIQFIINFVLIVSLIQIIFTSSYSSQILTIITTISYSIAIFSMSLLSYLFFKWFKIKRSALTMIYGLGSLFVAFNALISIILFDNVLFQKSPIIPSNTTVLFPGFDPGTFMSWIFNFQTYSNIIYFTLMWLGTVILLKYKISKIGRTKFFILTFLPLIYFMSYYFTIYDTMNPATPAAASIDMTGLILFFGYSSAVGGIIVSFGFREISKSVDNKNIKNFIIMTSTGFLLYFISSSASIGQAPYPPFGIIAVSLVGLSSLLILDGLYLSALYLSSDRKLRNLIKSKIDASRLIDEIGTAQMNIEMEKITLKVIEEHNNINDFNYTDKSISENEIKTYIDEILVELKNNNSKHLKKP